MGVKLHFMWLHVQEVSCQPTASEKMPGGQEHALTALSSTPAACILEETRRQAGRDYY
jgi:hypothetical protein